MPLILLSPAKSLDLCDQLLPKFSTLRSSQPIFSGVADQFAGELAKISLKDLKALLGVSDALATLNYERYKQWKEASSKRCVLMYAGEAYQGLQANELTLSDLEWAQDRLRILSGLYGTLRPLDEIKPYRLDMSKKLRPKGMDAYWRDQITQSVLESVKLLPEGERFIVNCASQEYVKAVDRTALCDVPMYEMMFPGPSVFAKNARGQMVRYIIENRINDPEQLKMFTGTNGSYSFSASKSDNYRFVYIRGKPRTTPATAKSQILNVDEVDGGNNARRKRKRVD